MSRHVRRPSTERLIVSAAQWDREHESDRWAYLEDTPVERARHALVGMLCRHYAPHGAILDVGCGEGTLVDFLSTTHRYTGIDISKEAVRRAHTRQRLGVQQSDAATFRPQGHFDVIVFGEILYYLDATSALARYSALLAPGGLIIVSTYRTAEHDYGAKTLKLARRVFEKILALDVSGSSAGIKVTWHIEALTRRPSRGIRLPVLEPNSEDSEERRAA